jgi:hypothetical protein|tara:strand:- start:783 stop:1112 length:330 start_codon:yes stop_codon:yes gene_type:complete
MFNNQPDWQNYEKIFYNNYMVNSYKNKFNKKYGLPKDKSNSLEEISKLSGYKLSGLKKILKKGEGAYFSNPSSVRPTVTSATQWGIARIYSAVMGGKAAKIDKDLLIKK